MDARKEADGMTYAKPYRVRLIYAQVKQEKTDIFMVKLSLSNMGPIFCYFERLIWRI